MTPLRTELTGRLAEGRRRMEVDPFTNAPQLFALDLSRAIRSGEVTLDQLETLTQQLASEAFAARAERLAAYLGDCSPDHLHERLDSLFRRLAEDGDFERYAHMLQGTPFGLVLTGHPTFALNHPLSHALIELATGFNAEGQPLTGEGRAERLAVGEAGPHGPPETLSLEVEHAWSVEALTCAHTALERVYGCALDVARERWPQRWSELTPRLATLATWVGFDQDGRTDVTWQVSIGKRLQLKAAALERRRAALAGLTEGAAGEWRSAVAAVEHVLDEALDTTRAQLDALEAAKADPTALPAFARTMVEGREVALVHPDPLMQRLVTAVEAAPDDQSRQALLIMRAGLAAQGVSLAGVHVRLNSGQLHNAIRGDVGLEGSPTDPTHRRTYFAAIDG